LIEEEEANELDDLEAFTYAVHVTSTLHVCASCGEERGGDKIPEKVLESDDPLFGPLDGDLVLISGEPIRVCALCRAVLRLGKRPKWATRFPPMDSRFTRLSPLEFRLVRPIVPVMTIYQIPGEGQYATVGGTVSFNNDVAKIAKRLPRPLSENGGVWLRSSRTTSSQVTRETLIRPNELRDLISEVISSGHPAFRGVELATEVIDDLNSREEDVSTVVLDFTLPGEDIEEAEREETNARMASEGLFSADARHVLLEEPAPGVDKAAFLRSLCGEKAGEGEAPAAATMHAVAAAAIGTVDMNDIQPHFSNDALVDEYSLGRSFYTIVFPQYFTNGHGGLDEAPPELTESEFINHCAFYYTRQFSLDHEFAATACTILPFYVKLIIAIHNIMIFYL
jgi:hypothetical protein